MSSCTHVSSNAPTQFLEVKGGERHAYRRFGSGPGLPLLLLQHFTGTLLTEAAPGGWGLSGQAQTNEELVSAARAEIGRLRS